MHYILRFNERIWAKQKYMMMLENFNQNCREERRVPLKNVPRLVRASGTLQSFQYYYVSKGFGSSRIRPTRFTVVAGGNQPALLSNAVTAQDLNMMINNVCIIIKLSWLLL